MIYAAAVAVLCFPLFQILAAAAILAIEAFPAMLREAINSFRWKNLDFYAKIAVAVVALATIALFGTMAWLSV